MSIISQKWSSSKIESEIAKHEWLYPFDFGNGIKTKPTWTTEANIAKRKAHIYQGLSLKGKRVLDIGSNEGYWAFHAFDSGASSVVGIEARQEYVDKANLVKRIKNYKNVEFHCMNIYDITPDRLGQFDVVQFFGVLYHLSEPMRALRALKSVCKEFVIVDTDVDYYRPAWDNVMVAYWEYDDRNHGEKMGAVEREEMVLIPTLTSLFDMLEGCGFVNLKQIMPDSRSADRYQSGKQVTIIAEIPTEQNKPYYSTKTPRYYGIRAWKLYKNVTIGGPWDTANGADGAFGYCCRSWVIQKDGDYEIEFVADSPISVDIIKNKKDPVYKSQNGGKFTLALKTGDTLEPRVLKNTVGGLEKITIRRVEGI